MLQCLQGTQSLSAPCSTAHQRQHCTLTSSHSAAAACLSDTQHTSLAGPEPHSAITRASGKAATVWRPAAGPHNALVGLDHTLDQPEGRATCSISHRSGLACARAGSGLATRSMRSQHSRCAAEVQLQSGDALSCRQTQASGCAHPQARARRRQGSDPWRQRAAWTHPARTPAA